MKIPNKNNNLSMLQIIANARNHLFRQIYGIGLSRFLDDAVRYNAVTKEERELINDIIHKIEILKNNRFENTKTVGLKPKRRCQYCKNIARYKAYIFDTTVFICNKHKAELERDNKQNYKGERLITNIEKINPYE